MREYVPFPKYYHIFVTRSTSNHVRLGSPEEGLSSWFLIENVHGVQYQKFAYFGEALLKSSQGHSQLPKISKKEVKALLGLAKSDRERELIRHSVCKSSGISSTAARKSFGFEHMNKRGKHVEEALKEAQYLALTQDKALLLTMGVDIPDSDPNSDSELEILSDLDSDSPRTEIESNNIEIEDLSLTDIGDSCEWNFFEINEIAGDNKVISSDVLDTLYAKLESIVTDNEKKDLLELSYRSFIASNANAAEDSKIASMMNGEIVTDSESDVDADYLCLNEECGTFVLSDGVKRTILKRRAAIKTQNQRYKAKLLAEQRFLSRKVTRNVRGILLDYPNIGKEIETFVSESNVGADCWRFLPSMETEKSKKR